MFMARCGDGQSKSWLHTKTGERETRIDTHSIMRKLMLMLIMRFLKACFSVLWKTGCKSNQKIWLAFKNFVFLTFMTFNIWCWKTKRPICGWEDIYCSGGFAVCFLSLQINLDFAPLCVSVLQINLAQAKSNHCISKLMHSSTVTQSWKDQRKTSFKIEIPPAWNHPSDSGESFKKSN